MYLLSMIVACSVTQKNNETTDSADSHLETITVEEGDGVIVPLVNLDEGKVLWMDHETGAVEQELVANLIHVQVWGDNILGLVEDLNGNSVSYIQEFDATGTPTRRFDTPLAHHTISVVGDKLYYIYADRIGPEDVTDSIHWIDLNTEETGVLIDTLDILDIEQLQLSFQGNDITHANTLVWEPVQERFYLSFAGINAVWTFDIFGDIDRIFLGKDASAVAYQEGTICEGGDFNKPHGGIGRLGDELFVLSSDEMYSEVQHYQCENAGLELTTVYPPPYEGFQSLAGGNLVLTASNIIINWGFAGVIESRGIESEDQEWIWESELGFGLGFVSWY